MSFPIPILFLIFGAGVLALVFWTFNICDKLSSILSSKYPDLYNIYGNRLKGNRRSPFFVLWNQDIKTLNDPDINAIKNKLKIVVALMCLLGWTGLGVAAYAFLYSL